MKIYEIIDLDKLPWADSIKTGFHYAFQYRTLEFFKKFKDYFIYKQLLNAYGNMGIISPTKKSISKMIIMTEKI